MTAEYNHGLPSVLKNALDYAYAEYNRKPATFVGYGSAGAAPAVEQLRLVLCGTAGGHAEAHRSCQRRRIHRHAHARQDLCRFPPISASSSTVQCWKIWCGGQMFSRPGVNRRRTRSPFEPDRSISPTLHTSMRWFVLRLFADLFFRPDNLIEAIAVVGLEDLLRVRAFLRCSPSIVVARPAPTC